MKKAIAMKCTQEQFDAIKDKLVDITMITNFSESSYLINCYKDSRITNLPSVFKSIWAKEVHETWNEQIFLEACGIERIIMGSELQYRNSKAGSEWVDCVFSEYRFKPDNSLKIQELENQIKELQEELKKL